MRPGACLNIKMSSYQYTDSHYKNKTVWRPTHLYNENPHTWKIVVLIKQPWRFKDMRSGACPNIKMSSCQYKDSHYKDKTVWPQCHLYNGNRHTRKIVVPLRWALMFSKAWLCECVAAFTLPRYLPSKSPHHPCLHTSRDTSLGMKMARQLELTEAE